MTMMSVSVVAFAGGSNWPIWVAAEKGFFAAHGLQVTLEFTPNSVEMVKNVMADRYQIAMTAFDNIVAYQEGQGEVALPQAPDFFAFMGGDPGFLNVMAVPGIESLADLAGKEASVDAMTTGFAFVLREILGDTAVTYRAVGGGAQRMKALLAKEQSVTLLNSPLDLVAEAGGCRRLARAEPVIGPYLGVTGMARRSWAASNGAAIIAFLRGYGDAIAWLYDRANREAAEALLVAKAPGMTAPIATRSYDVLLADNGGLFREFHIDKDRAATVLRLRSKYGRPQKTLQDADRYIDMSFVERAS